MPEIDNPPPDLDYEGDAMDMATNDGHVIGFRRHGPVVTFGVDNAVTALDSEQAEFVARQLFAASVAARAARED